MVCYLASMKFTFPLLMLSLLLACSTERPPWAGTPVAADLILTNGKVYTLASFKKKVLLMWYEGPKSKEQNRWLKNKLTRVSMDYREPRMICY